MREKWRERAACRGLPTEMFFPIRGKKTIDVYAEAKKYCRGCPVKQECLAVSDEFISSGDRYGMYGGYTPRERQELRRESGRRAASLG